MSIVKPVKSHSKTPLYPAINVHSRVELINSFLDPAWVVVDFGCGDAYLSKLRAPGITYNVDRVAATKEPVTVCDLEQEIPDLQGDCAVCSGLLEWLDDPIAFLGSLSKKFPLVYFSYATTKGDKRWQYKCTIEEIVVAALIRFNCKLSLEAWQNQIIFFLERRKP